jgi:regulator of protease activity HflC (stomatin/prohibitin superfamily)
VAGVLVGIYFLFAIVVVDQWEKVAVLRFGKYRGLRGPGLVLIIPIVETLSRYVDQRARDHSQRRVHADARHGSRQRGRDHLLAGVERGEIDPRSGGLSRRPSL